MRGEGWRWGAVGAFALAPLMIALKHTPDRVSTVCGAVDELGDTTGPSAAAAAPPSDDGLGGSEAGLGGAGGRPALETRSKQNQRHSQYKTCATGGEILHRLNFTRSPHPTMVTLRAIAPPAPRLGTPTRKTVRFISPHRLEPDASTLPSDSNSESKPKPTSHRLGPLFTRPPSNSRTKRNPNPKLSTPLLLASRRTQVILRRISRTARVLGKLARLIQQRAKEEAKDVSQCRCASDWFCPLHGFTASTPPPRARGEVRVIPSRRALPVELPVKDEGAGARWRAEHERCNPPLRTLRSRSPTPGPDGPRIRSESPAEDASATPPSAATPTTVNADATSDVLLAASAPRTARTGSPPVHLAQWAHEAERRARQTADMQWRYFALQVRCLRAGPIVPVPARTAAEPSAEARAEARVEAETARNTAANRGADEVGDEDKAGDADDADDADEAAVVLSPSHDSDAEADSDSESDSDSDSDSDDSDPTPWPWNDLHLGFAPPPTAHEPDLDYPTRLAMFKVMRHLGRRDRADVEMLEDAFVMRNWGAAEIRRKELQEAEDQEDDEEEEVDAYGCIERKTALPGAPAPPPPWYKGADCLGR
ncbi:hypothetical protein DFH08DRAFT_974365 [Mycena albidolilacea]|uniref:Uncharacterized protein n=1 Tax=Mycena albidolilacea TaxID=1033008 RepID=A0AAD7EC07_9AGAR|nr:hypothetical protein DFH08DRAFT_974365 [Mycena albidolilacea]